MNTKYGHMAIQYNNFKSLETGKSCLQFVFWTNRGKIEKDAIEMESFQVVMWSSLEVVEGWRVPT